jgi:hypothetical protein
MLRKSGDIKGYSKVYPGTCLYPHHSVTLSNLDPLNARAGDLRSKSESRERKPAQRKSRSFNTQNGVATGA